jgi:TetR/AcrR family transcriptional repressor of nem operon
MPKNGTETRLEILDAAQDLILAQGFAGTSVDAILGRTRLTKGAFFHHFPSKHDLALALVERYAAGDSAMLRRNLERAERLHRDPLQQLLIFLGLLEESAEQLADPSQGCLFAAYVYEAQLFDERVHDVIRNSVVEWRSLLGEKLRAAAALHPPRMAVDWDEVADMVTVVAEGAYVMAKTTGDVRTLARQFRHMRNYLELLFAQV